MIHERKIPFYKRYHFEAYPDIDLRWVIKKHMKANPTKLPGKNIGDFHNLRQAKVFTEDTKGISQETKI